MEKKNTLLRYAGIRDDGYRDYLEVVLLGNMTDALTERMRKAIAASGFDFDPMELHLPSWPDKPTVYEIVVSALLLILPTETSPARTLSPVSKSLAHPRKARKARQRKMMSTSTPVRARTSSSSFA